MLVATLAVALARLPDDGSSRGRFAAVRAADGRPPRGRRSLGSWALLTTALAIAVVGFTDNVLTARAFGARHGDRIDARRELLALGAANVAAGVVHGFPVSSSGSRTAIVDAVGGRSRWSGLATLGAALVLVVALRPVLARFPDAALAAVVVYAGLRLIDVKEFARIARYRRTELLIALATTFGVLVLGVLQGVLVAVSLSLVGRAPSGGPAPRRGRGAGPRPGGDARRRRLRRAPWSCPACSSTATTPRSSSPTPTTSCPACASPSSAYDPEWVLLNAEAIGEVDLTGADALETLRAELAEKGIVLALARLKQDPRDVLRPSGLLERIGDEHIFPTLPMALEGYRAATGRE